MPLTQQDAPEETKQALLAGIGDYLSPADPLREELAREKQGLKVWVLALEALSNGAGLSGAQQVGWGFLAGRPGVHAIAAQITTSGVDQKQELTAVAQGPEVALLIQSIHKVQDVVERQNGSYELEILRIPGILLEAFWLKASEGPDLIVPFHTMSKELDSLRPYSVDEFIAVARSLADAFRRFDEFYPAQADLKDGSSAPS
jgi:hypothetical protein